MVRVRYYMAMRIASVLLMTMCLVWSAISPLSAATAGKIQKVYVSAYYTPVPGQKQYLHRTYAAELRVNGGDDTGADGTKVYPGMLAAPRTYSFGTKITIPTLGTGTVHDRGGWVANGTVKRRYDRIDVWMGTGDAGLLRAKKWGVRLVEVTVYPSSATDIPESIAFPR